MYLRFCFEKSVYVNGEAMTITMTMICKVLISSQRLFHVSSCVIFTFFDTAFMQIILRRQYMLLQNNRVFPK